MIQSIWIKSFRCLSELLIEFKQNRVVSIIAKNNVGKTSVLEACYILGYLKSFIAKDISNIVPYHMKSAYMGIKIKKNESEYNYYLKVNQEGKKFLNLNNEVVKKKESVQSLFRSVYISSDSLLFVNSTPSYRRALVDTMISQISLSYRKNIASYKQLIMQKNKLLKMGDNTNLYVYIHQQLAPLILDINKQRKTYMSKLEKLVRGLFFKIGIVEGEFVLEYNSKISIYKQENLIIEQMNKQLINEKQAKITLFGPHRDDYEFKINNKKAKEFYSRGVCRTLAYLFQLSQAMLILEETKLPMLLLLDEPYAEIYKDIKSMLIKYIPKDFYVIYASSQQNEMDEFNSGNLFELDNGALCKI